MLKRLIVFVTRLPVSVAFGILFIIAFKSQYLYGLPFSFLFIFICIALKNSKKTFSYF
jgi:hypothetical protein